MKRSSGRHVRRVALLLWGDVFEDYLDDIGWSIEDFCERMTGGWAFGYADALAHEGVEVVMVCVSRSVTRTERRISLNGITIVLLPATWSLRIARRFLRSRYRYLVGNQPPVSRLEQLAHHVLPYLATPRRRLRRMLIRERCDALMNQSYEDARFDIAVQVGHRLGIPVFATAQGGEFHRSRCGGFRRSRLESFLRPRSFSGAAEIIVPSRAEERRVVRTYGLDESKVALVMNPIDDGVWFPEDRAETREALEVPPDALLVAWHGRVDLAQKGLDVLLVAWTLVRACMTDQPLHLILVGSGRDDEILRERLRGLGDAGITWIDEYIGDRSRMRRVLSSADLYAFPSRGEDQPTALLEAMACGLPVVAADGNGVPDIFEDGEASGGVVVPPGNAPALADAMFELLNDPARRQRLSLQAQIRVADAFLLKDVGSALAATLESARAPLKAHSQTLRRDNSAASSGQSDDGDEALVSIVMPSNRRRVRSAFEQELIPAPPQLQSEFLERGDLLWVSGRVDEALRAYEEGLEHSTDAQLLHKRIAGLVETTRGLEGAFRYYGLERVDDREISIGQHEIVCGATVRDEADVLPYFLEYHERLGVDRFLIVDNLSRDETLEILLANPKVHLWQTGMRYWPANAGAAWIEVLFRGFALDHWCLVVDPDELFCYPEMETRRLPELCAQLDKAGKLALPAVLLDMYADRPVRDAVYRAGQDPVEVSPFFDRKFSHWRSTAGPWQNFEGFAGGLRRRAFGKGSNPALSKIPLFRYTPDRVIAGGVHSTNARAEEIASERGAVLHFKFTARFLERLEAELRDRRADAADPSESYATYKRALDEKPDLCLYDPMLSVRLRDSRQLIELGVMSDGKIAIGS